MLVKLLYLISSILACTKPVVRREIRELSIEERHRFFATVNELHNRNHSAVLSKHEYFSEVHFKYKDEVHNLPLFLPWHRRYLQEYEDALREIDPNVVLPYWDWSLDAQAPHNSPILSDEYIGGNGDAANDYCLKDGPFRGWFMKFPFNDPHCLRRSYDLGINITSFSITEQNLLYINEPTFSKFSFLLEEKHGYPHLFIGGDYGDFAPMWSPNDPLFYLHHTFIDMLWYQWQQRHPDVIQYEGDEYEVPAGLNDVLAPYPDTAQDMVSTTSGKLCYTYPEYPRAIYTKNNRHVRSRFESLIKKNPIISGPLRNATIAEALARLPAMIDTQNSTVPRTVPLMKPSGPFSDEWIIKFEFNLVKFRKHATDSETLISLLNELPGFVSFSQISELALNTPK